jgi:AraC family transcriptional regulator, exoenzyme S synthesis regulatory protein ExsA
MDCMDNTKSVEELVGNFLYSCIQSRNREHEQFNAEHAMGYIISGSTQFFTAQGASAHGPGSMGLVKRHMLIKATKIPPANGQFKSISLRFSPEALQRYAATHPIGIIQPYTGIGMHSLDGDPFIKGFFDSLIPYFESKKPFSEAMVDIKTQEAIELLLQHDPDLRHLLFDFAEPYKIDLKEYMERHFMFNVPMTHFAKVTGRSLASFKRDFERTFSTSPGKWLQRRRLQEAYRLLQSGGATPSGVYLDVGFENMSHFNFAFKKAFGQTPGALARQSAQP